MNFFRPKEYLNYFSKSSIPRYSLSSHSSRFLLLSTAQLPLVSNAHILSPIAQLFPSNRFSNIHSIHRKQTLFQRPFRSLKTTPPSNTTTPPPPSNTTTPPPPFTTTRLGIEIIRLIEILKNWFPLVTIGITVVILSVWVFNDWNEPRKIKKAVYRGYCPPANPTEEIMERPELESELKLIIQPIEGSIKKNYFLITGEHGTGKTTIVQKVCREAGSGVIYVSAPNTPGNIIKELALAIDYRFNNITLRKAMESKFLGIPVGETKKKIFNDPKEVNDGMGELKEALEKVTVQYRKETKKQVVLVIDNCNIFAKEFEKEFSMLQDWAKEMADRGLVRVVFVASEGFVPRFLLSRSSSSRIGSIKEIGDISDETAKSFLIKQNLPSELAERLVSEVTGGRFQYLNQVANSAKDLLKAPSTSTSTSGSDQEKRINEIFEVLKKEIMSTVKQHFKEAGFNGNEPHRKCGEEVIRALLSSKNNTISMDQFETLVEETAFQNKLLSAQVFSFHLYEDTVTFQSRAALTYAKQKYKVNQDSKLGDSSSF